MGREAKEKIVSSRLSDGGKKESGKANRARVRGIGEEGRGPSLFPNPPPQSRVVRFSSQLCFLFSPLSESLEQANEKAVP